MLQYVKHGDRGAAFGAKRSAIQAGAGSRRVVPRPRESGSLQGEIEAHYAKAAVLQQPEKEPATAAHVKNRPAFAQLFERPFDEAHMVAQHDPPVGLLQPAGGGLLRRKPVIL